MINIKKKILKNIYATIKMLNLQLTNKKNNNNKLTLGGFNRL